MNDNQTIPSTVTHQNRSATLAPLLAARSAGSVIPAKKFVAKGHDRQLEEAQFNNLDVKVRLMDDETPMIASIVRRDKFTVTFKLIEDSPCGNFVAGDELLTYKHAIGLLCIARRSN